MRKVQHLLPMRVMGGGRAGTEQASVAHPSSGRGTADVYPAGGGGAPMPSGPQEGLDSQPRPTGIAAEGTIGPTLFPS